MSFYKIVEGKAAKNEINITSRKIKNMIKMTSFMIMLSEHESDKAIKVKKRIKIWKAITKAFSNIKVF